MKTTKMLLSGILTGLLAISLSCAEEAVIPEAPTLNSAGLSLGIHEIAYPQLSGLSDESLQNEINAKIIAAGNIDTLLARLPLVMSGETPVRVTWEGGIYGDWLSIAMCTSGPIELDGKTTEIWSSVNLNLQTGEALTYADLSDPGSGDPDVLPAYIESYLDYEIAPELSAHLENSELTPIPDHWRMDEHGLQLYYPIGQLSTLHSKAGVIQLDWYELAMEPDVLNMLAEDGNPVFDAGGLNFLQAGEYTLPAITADCTEGRLPGLNVTIGDSMQAMTDTYGLLTDPDWFEGGRMFALEGAPWRGTWLLTDKLTEKTWDTSTVNGIRADRISLYGLCTGVTTIDAWRAVLGTPASTVALDEETADLWRMVPGTSDYYLFDTHTLRLHADENGVLTTVILQ